MFQLPFLKKMCEKRLVTKDCNFSGFPRDDDITCVSIFSFLLHILYKSPFWGIGVQEKRFKNRLNQFVSNRDKLALGKICIFMNDKPNIFWLLYIISQCSHFSRNLLLHNIRDISLAVRRSVVEEVNVKNERK